MNRWDAIKAPKRVTSFFHSQYPLSRSLVQIPCPDLLSRSSLSRNATASVRLRILSAWLGFSPSALLKIGRVQTAQQSMRFCVVTQSVSPPSITAATARRVWWCCGCWRWMRRRRMLVSARTHTSDPTHLRGCRCCRGSTHTLRAAEYFRGSSRRLRPKVDLPLRGTTGHEF